MTLIHRKQFTIHRRKSVQDYSVNIKLQLCHVVVSIRQFYDDAVNKIEFSFIYISINLHYLLHIHTCMHLQDILSSVIIPMVVAASNAALVA